MGLAAYAVPARTGPSRWCLVGQNADADARPWFRLPVHPAESAGQAGLTNGLGLPIPAPGKSAFVLTLLTALGTPIARRFEIWDSRSAKVGSSPAAELLDGICERDGPLWDEDKPRRISPWQGLIGKVLGSGLPALETGPTPSTAGYAGAVALPIYQQGELSHIVAWYC